MLQVQQSLSLARSYKLFPGYEEAALGVLFHEGNRGSVGSNAPVVTSGAAAEFQVRHVQLQSRPLPGCGYTHMVNHVLLRGIGRCAGWHKPMCPHAS